MLMTAARQQAALALSHAESRRKPFLRRSLRADALLTTDLPQAATTEVCEAFAQTLRTAGWRVLPTGDFLELTPPLAAPLLTDAPGFGLNAPNLRRLHHVLTLHPDGEASEADVLALMKAEEAGERSLEAWANNLCRRCSALLRTHAALPGALLPWVRAALKKEEPSC